MLILSGDIGGTNTRLQLATFDNQRLEVMGHEKYLNADFDSLQTIISRFLAAHKVATTDLYSACLAIAGPIINNTVRVTNLPWFIDGDILQQELGIAKIKLINDFKAVGHGVETLLPTDIVMLQPGKPQPSEAPKAIIGAGTGLGVALMFQSKNGHYSVIPTEGGHADFAPTDDEQIALLLELRKKLHRVSVERVVSGIGLTNIYKFVRDNPLYGEKENPKLRLALHQTKDVAATISEFAIEHRDPLAQRALNLFIRAYGSAAGNLALTTLCFGGLYLVGGIAPKLLPQLKSGAFMQAFSDKGRMSKLIADIPVYVVLDTLIGLKGAAIYAARL